MFDGPRRPTAVDSPLYIAATCDYVPEGRVDNWHFARLTGREPDWFERRTGVLSRSRARAGENTNTMALEAVARLAGAYPRALEGIDLILGASYTPWDTIGTLAHAVQRRFALRGARAMLLSSACSSFIDALEVAASFIESRRASRALIVAAEHNSLFAADEDEHSGHLWGDGAVAVLVGREPLDGPALQVRSLTAFGLAHVGIGPQAVYLEPRGSGLVMPHGKDVFRHACLGMEQAARLLLDEHGLEPRSLRFLIAHQANRRIIDHVAERLGLERGQVATTLEELGNTGCASAPITLSRHWDRLAPGDQVLMVVFGGGYSAGGALLQMR